jgi:hypothetical protein
MHVLSLGLLVREKGNEFIAMSNLLQWRCESYSKCSGCELGFLRRSLIFCRFNSIKVLKLLFQFSFHSKSYQEL